MLSFRISRSRLASHDSGAVTDSGLSFEIQLRFAIQAAVASHEIVLVSAIGLSTIFAHIPDLHTYGSQVVLHLVVVARFGQVAEKACEQWPAHLRSCANSTCLSIYSLRPEGDKLVSKH